MFKFIDKKIGLIKNNDIPISERLDAYRKAIDKLEKIRTKLKNVPSECDEITENNLDETIENITQSISNIDIDEMKLSDLQNLLELKTMIETCKEFLSSEKMTKIFVHDKEGTTSEITDKMKSGLFIEQIKK